MLGLSGHQEVETGRGPWPLPGMESVLGGGVSLWSPAHNRECLENVGLGLPKSSLMCFVQSSDKRDVSAQRL